MPTLEEMKKIRKPLLCGGDNEACGWNCPECRHHGFDCEGNPEWGYDDAGFWAEKESQ